MRFNLRLPQGKYVETAREIYEIFSRARVMRSAAALGYFLTITIFPTVMCAMAILSRQNVPTTGMRELLERFMPEPAIAVIADFMRYVESNTSPFMFVIAASVMLTSSSAAFRTILSVMGDIQGKRRYTGIWGFVFSFLMSIAFLAAIYLSGVVIVTGEWFLVWLEENLDLTGISGVWTWLRFILLFTAMFLVIFGIYAIAAPKATRRLRKLPGAFAASAVMVAVSAIFSRMISASVRYAIVYGSLASVIIMMTWLYLCGIIIIMGNVLNISLSRIIMKKKGVADGD